MTGDEIRKITYLRIPIAVVHNDNISSGQIDTQTSSTRTQKENEFGAIGSIEFFDLRLEK